MVVSVVHVLRGRARSPVLDGRQVRRISAYLVEGDLDASPGRLVVNGGKAFVGMYLLGLGFTFDEEAVARGKPALPVSEMERLIAENPRNAERIFPYLGGEEVSTDPRQEHRRWCIDFNDFPLRRDSTLKSWMLMDKREEQACKRVGVVPWNYPEPVAADWPELLQILERRVKPERLAKKGSERDARWWHFLRSRPALRAAITGLDTVLVRALTSANFCTFAFVPAAVIYDQTLIVFATSQKHTWSILSSRVHEVWTREFGSSLKDDSRYNVVDCFETFPMSDMTSTVSIGLAEDYYEYRSRLMITRQEGLTKTYNRFHNEADHTEETAQLRLFHHELDQAVLRAYGWDDLARDAAPEFLNEHAEPEYQYQGRLFWPAPFRDEVLARLLELNAKRAADERARGLAPAPVTAEEMEDA